MSLAVTTGPQYADEADSRVACAAIAARSAAAEALSSSELTHAAGAPAAVEPGGRCTAESQRPGWQAACGRGR